MANWRRGAPPTARSSLPSTPASPRNSGTKQSTGIRSTSANPTTSGTSKVDLRPCGHTAQAFVGTRDDGEILTEPRDILQGNTITTGTTNVAGYGTTPLKRVAFLARTIRDHLQQAERPLHDTDLSSPATLIGDAIR